MLKHFFRQNDAIPHLFDSNTFYVAFKKDLRNCRREAIIESPFMTLRRLDEILPILRQVIARGVIVTINTKPPQEHDDYMRLEAENGIPLLQSEGINVLFTGGHHRKLAIFDRKILWDGSLNILSQSDSCEIMVRTGSKRQAQQVISFIGIEQHLK